MAEKIEDTAEEVESIDKLVSRRVRYRRRLLGISQRELGEYVKVSIQQIQKYEKGTNRISSGKLYAFSILLKVPIIYFFNVKEDNEFVDETNGLAESEITSLLKVYGKIDNVDRRRKLIDLIKTLIV